MKLKIGMFVKMYDKEHNIAVIESGDETINLPIIDTGVDIHNYSEYAFLMIYNENTVDNNGFAIGVAFPLHIRKRPKFKKKSGGIVTNDSTDPEENQIVIGTTDTKKLTIGNDNIALEGEGTNLTLTDNIILNGPVRRDNYKESYGLIEKNPLTVFPIPDFPTATLTNTSSLDIFSILNIVKEVLPMAIDLMALFKTQE